METEMTTNRYIGSPVERIEDRRSVTPRTAFRRHSTQPQAHGRIRSIDAAAAQALPGVHAVITAVQIGSPVPRIPIRLQPLPVLAPYYQPVIAERKVRYVGEPIAVVLADSTAIAEDALDAIGVDIEQLPPVVDRH